MSGLRRICKLYGGMTVAGNDGKTIRYVWDYANDEPVPESAMPFGSERHKASERARWLPADGVPEDVKTGWPAPELMQDDDRGLSRALADPLGEILRRKPVSIKAMPAGVKVEGGDHGR